jgi:hypothetical protein
VGCLHSLPYLCSTFPVDVRRPAWRKYPDACADGCRSRRYQPRHEPESQSWQPGRPGLGGQQSSTSAADEPAVGVMPVTTGTSGHLSRYYVPVGERWRTADGQWCVDAICLSAIPDRRDGEWLRVRWRGYWKADVRTVAGLARLAPLDRLLEAPLAVRAVRSWHAEHHHSGHRVPDHERRRRVCPWLSGRHWDVAGRGPVCAADRGAGSGRRGHRGVPRRSSTKRRAWA